MLDKIKEFFIGNLDSASLKDEIRQSQSAVVVKDFGVIGGKVYFVKPKDGIELPAFLEQFDKFPQGRSADNIVNFFVGGPFILTRTDTNVIHYHKLYTQSLSRFDDYVQYIITALKDHLHSTTNLKELITNVVRQALAKGLFNIDQLTPEFAKALESFSQINQEENNSFAQTVLFHLIGTYYLSLLKFKSDFSQARSQYIESATAFIRSQTANILKDFQSYMANETVTNLLSLSVIELLKEQHPLLRDDRGQLSKFMSENAIQPYLEDAYIRTLPASIFPGDNLITILMCAIMALNENNNLVSELRQEIEEAQLLEDNDKSIPGKINENKANNGLLHRVYLESLRRESLQKNVDELEFGSLIWRYNEEAIEIDGQIIPKNSMVALINSMPRFDSAKWEKPEQFNPQRFFNKTNEQSPASIFSYGKRKCPGQAISEYIFKTFIAYLVMNFDFSLELDEKNSASIHLTAREEQQITSTNYWQ